MKWWRKK